MKNVSTSSSPTRRLTILYICALSSVALLAILGQIAVQIAIGQQSSDANVINLAGRQRMLSQRISKTALILEITNDAPTRTARTYELQQAVNQWERSQRGLQQGDALLGLPGKNSDEVKRLYSKIEPNYQLMLGAAQSIPVLEQQGTRGASQRTVLEPLVQTILAQESGFLVGMDQIVSQYQREAEARVTTLRTIEFVLLGVLLVMLFIEGFLIFRPTAQRLDVTIQEITALQRSISKQKEELESGIEQILQTHMQTANGNFTARAPLSQDHVLWQIRLFA